RQLCIRILAWMALAFFSGLLGCNRFLYFNAPLTHAFVWDQGALAERSVWMISLVIHVIAGMVCVMSSFL
ncbi:MAG: hypothetical protein ACK46A_03015, partial [Akkermansiaceae bacterium]